MAKAKKWSDVADLLTKQDEWMTAMSEWAKSVQEVFKELEEEGENVNVPSPPPKGWP